MRNKDSFIFNKKGNPIDCIYMYNFFYLFIKINRRM